MLLKIYVFCKYIEINQAWGRIEKVKEEKQN